MTFFKHGSIYIWEDKAKNGKTGHSGFYDLTIKRYKKNILGVKN